MRFGRWGLPALVAVAMLCAIGAPRVAARPGPAPQARRASPSDARVVGTFAMSARVTAAVNVRGEHVGERLARTWRVVPSDCRASVCQLLRLDRDRSGGRHARITLHRVGPGRYFGQGVFYVGLVCLGRVHPYGSRVPYQITLTVRAATRVDGIRFARQITATYVNPQRSDSTQCPLGPSHDAARYTGTASSPPPSPPTVSFSTVFFPRDSDRASFTDESQAGTGEAAIVSLRWRFGDPRSGGADTSTLVAPPHLFSAPGVYAVSLTVTDANGLSSAGVQSVTAPGPPNASFTATELGPGATFSFTDGSTPGVAGAPIVAWRWAFGDPVSGAQDASTAQSPSHTFSMAGAYPVTLTITDANGFTASTTRQVLAPP
jgi:PKD repeat protein